MYAGRMRSFVPVLKFNQQAELLNPRMDKTKCVVIE